MWLHNSESQEFLSSKLHCVEMKEPTFTMSTFKFSEMTVTLAVAKMIDSKNKTIIQQKQNITNDL